MHVLNWFAVFDAFAKLTEEVKAKNEVVLMIQFDKHFLKVI